MCARAAAETQSLSGSRSGCITILDLGGADHGASKAVLSRCRTMTKCPEHPLNSLPSGELITSVARFATAASRSSMLRGDCCRPCCHGSFRGAPDTGGHRAGLPSNLVHSRPSTTLDAAGYAVGRSPAAVALWPKRPPARLMNEAVRGEVEDGRARDARDARETKTRRDGAQPAGFGQSHRRLNSLHPGAGSATGRSVGRSGLVLDAADQPANGAQWPSRCRACGSGRNPNAGDRALFGGRLQDRLRRRSRRHRPRTPSPRRRRARLGRRSPGECNEVPSKLRVASPPADSVAGS